MSKSHQIGLMIRTCRESRGISQEYMADMLNIAQSAYAYIESGKTTLSVDRLIRITDLLQMDIHQVINESRHNLHSQDETPLLSEFTVRNAINGNEMLIRELRDEIHFLRDLVKKEFKKESG